ncbi:MAG: S-adenosylmethionine:tRNA ribosyltransferase-isomerase [Flavobacteriales bacterium]|nr:S-adenosylmethionine:tRNA ribosyltransferase-isomerase [Flavobacteriales bacterium]
MEQIKKDPRSIRISDYHYELPQEKIAVFPSDERDSSRLLIYKEGSISESNYRSIANELTAGSLLFFNNTKVINARLEFKNSNGGRIEVFCLEPSENKDMAQAMAACGSSAWNCMVGGLSKWREEDLLLEQNGIRIKVSKQEVTSQSVLVQFTWQPQEKSFAEILHEVGALPIPPYLKRDTEAIDIQRYQTVYAKHEGSVAAPTAGLHFTERVFADLKAHHCEVEYLTLHVGAGTFKPVKSEQMEGHDMHAETIDVQRSVIHKIAGHSGSRVAVGTTSMRTLESLYWIGLKLAQQPTIRPEQLDLKQWEVYEMQEQTLSLSESMQHLLHWMDRFELDRLICSTSILIAPGYDFKVVDALVTNFHQPGSTLILLVAAFVGEDWRKIYDYALHHHFRFLSYGDGSLLFRNKNNETT